MDHPLGGFALKLNRAEEHLKGIRGAAEELTETDFYETTTELDYKRRPVGRFRNVRQPELLKSTVPLLIGDCIYNYRSALDHLAYVLASAHTMPLPEAYAKTSAFPIFKNRARYRADAPRKMRGMSRFARGAIERVQPYHRRKDPALQFLWVLEELSNIDKHRLIHLTAAGVAGGGGYVSGLGGVTAVGIQEFAGPIEEGTKFQRMLGDFPDPAEVKMNPHLIPNIIFDQRTEARSVRGQPVIPVIEAIRAVIGFRVIAELHDELRRLFPGIEVGIQVAPAPGGA